MDVNKLLEYFHENKTISEEIIEAIQNDNALRIDLVNYFREHKNREFTLALSDVFSTISRKPESERS